MKIKSKSIAKNSITESDFNILQRTGISVEKLNRVYFFAKNGKKPQWIAYIADLSLNFVVRVITDEKFLPSYRESFAKEFGNILPEGFYPLIHCGKEPDTSRHIRCPECGGFVPMDTGCYSCRIRDFYEHGLLNYDKKWKEYLSEVSK